MSDSCFFSVVQSSTGASPSTIYHSLVVANKNSTMSSFSHQDIDRQQRRPPLSQVEVVEEVTVHESGLIEESIPILLEGTLIGRGFAAYDLHSLILAAIITSAYQMYL